MLDAAVGVEAESAVDLPLAHRERVPRLVDELGRQRRDLGVERRGGDAAQRKPDRGRLGAAEQPSRVDQLPRALHADRPRKADRAAPAGHPAGRRLAVADLRVVGREDQVTGQRQLEAGAGRDPADRSDHGNVERLEREAGRGDARQHVLEVLEIAEGGLEDLGVDAGAEDAVAAADHEHAHSLVRLDAPDDIGEVVERLLREAVALIRARERR